MDPERWQQIKAVLYDAIERLPSERSGFLDHVCRGDTDLRAEVEVLLQSHVEADGFLDSPPSLLHDLPAALEGEPVTTHERRVGPYRLLRLLGSGGMGEVFLGERADGLFDQRVAVKVVKNVDTRELLRRFEAERRILAALQHPNIARLLGGGTTADGRPFFAMEYIDGDPLTDYAADRGLSLEARLELLEAVGQAVHHAHRNLVVHRDLKPSNILVTEDDEGRPQVKLLDFGIAKLMQDDDEQSVRTETGARLMTRAYAAPEQIRCEPVTTATDVYALGVVLYELLTGHRPFDAPTPHALEQAILEGEPESPSTAARHTATTGSSGHENAAAKPQETPAWTKKLQGDLDMVCLKAVRKEPTERYASAEAFVADIRRYLAGLPVEARAPTPGYRLRKFIQRHRAGSAATAIVFALVIAFAVAMAWQQSQTVRQRDRAERELVKSEAVTDFLMELFAANKPSEARGATITARELLERGVERLAELDGQPEVRTLMMDHVGRIYKNLGDYDKAEPLLEEALAERRRYLGGPHEDVAVSLSRLSALRADQGRYEEALQLSREALAMRRVVPGEQHPAIVESLFQLATQYKFLGDYDESEQRFRELLALQRTLYDQNDVRIAATLNNFGRLLDAKLDYEAAHARYLEALAIYRQHYEADHPEIIYTRSNIGLALCRAGRYDECVREMEEVVTLRRRVFGAEHPGLASSLITLGLALSGQGKPAQAVERHEEAIEIYRNAQGEHHPNVASGLYNRARAYHEAGDREAAEASYREALAIGRKALGDDHPRVARMEMYLGRLLHERHEYAAAEAFYKKALATSEQKLGKENRNAIILRRWLEELHEATDLAISQ